MKKNELFAQIADETGVSAHMAEVVCNRMLALVAQSLSNGEDVSLAGFGSFQVKQRAERQGRNPQTGEPMTIAASKAVGFKAAKALKDAVNG